MFFLIYKEDIWKSKGSYAKKVWNLKVIQMK